MAMPSVDVATPAGITVRGLTRTFRSNQGDTTALEDVELTVGEGEFLCVVGPSGCGKTTLLKILAGLEQPDAGEATYHVEGSPRQAMVFQEQGVFPWMTVLDNAAYGLTVRGVSRSRREEIARRYLRRLGIGRYEGHYPRQLSGGMRQRVNVARAFATDPAVLLMDEPFASLDEQTRLLVHRDLLELWQGSRKTVVFITHGIDEAVLLGDRIAVMTRRPGRIKEIIEVGLPRPRTVDAMHDSAFLDVRRRVWEALRTEIATLESGPTFEVEAS
jgi:NitT/TauT family transport system ATP-binding protein